MQRIPLPDSEWTRWGAQWMDKLIRQWLDIRWILTRGRGGGCTRVPQKVTGCYRELMGMTGG